MGWGRTAVPLVLIIAILAGVTIAFNAPEPSYMTGQVIGVMATSTSCGSYSTSASCTAYSNCVWNNDTWGAWCQEINCYSLYTQSDCQGKSIAGKNCSWKTGETKYYCEDATCFTYSGTNSSACVNNALGLSCEWIGSCFSSGAANPYQNCWNYLNESSCLNATGCTWGNCNTKNCWSYNTSQTCLNGKDWRGENCTWDSTYSNCAENTCWRLGANGSATTSEKQVQCENTSSGLNCEWKWNNCNEKECWSWDNTNQSACENNTLNLSCMWQNSFCMRKQCWVYGQQSDCQSKPRCVWKSYYQSGWCQEVQCWNWDSWNNGNQTACQSNPYSLSCTWSTWSGNSSQGSCYPSATNTCSNFTTEKECMDTSYCWWRYTDQANPSGGGSCNDPGNFSLDTNTSIFTEWNPGCYVFDSNASVCNATMGCNYSIAQSKCILLAGHANAGVINTSGINCTMLNDTSLCNTVGVLSSCCSWRNNTCETNRLTTSCWDQMQQKSERSCEDAETKTRCDAISNSPWFMPCSWSGDNSSGKCRFRASDIFGNGSVQSLLSIDNKKSCEAAGGKWMTENYCEGNVSVPSGRCENKFDGEDNCDKACFACEIKDNNGASVNASNARSACEGSNLGICEFTASSRAPNGVGFCKSKDQFKRGLATDCGNNCGDCTFMGDTDSNDTTKRPDYICNTRKADASGEKCKWDNGTQTCVEKSDKICMDSCDRCETQSECQDMGRTAVTNKTGSCRWQGDSSSGSCVFNIGYDVEICWDGTDNTNDTLVDCADPGCYSDPFCGFVSGGCSGWTTSATCASNGCEWVQDNWGSWCDIKGGQCWKYNQNTTVCTAQTNCQWNNGTGSAWCEQDMSRSDVCMGKTKTQCDALTGQGCNWTVDSWCVGQGNATDWCKNSGGWCEYEALKPKNCWQYTSGSSECNNKSGCAWHPDSYTIPHCETNTSGNCMQYSSNSSCTDGGCWWRNDTWGGWCDIQADRCYAANNQNACNTVTDSAGNTMCYWETWGGGTGTGYCTPMCYNSSRGSQSACNSLSSCMWRGESGWCGELGVLGCSNATVYSNEANCRNVAGCRWKFPGWCEPIGGGFSAASASSGGGIGGAVAAECFKYDGNETACTNKSMRTDNLNISCGWFNETNPRCEVNWSASCWQHQNSTACGSAGCWWKSDFFGSWCTNYMDQCMNNQSLQTETTCNTNGNCTWDGWGCQPACSNKTTSNSCTSGQLSGKCKWITGWCNPSGMTEMFDSMEAGAPVPLGFDVCPESGVQASIDICGFGMKDMGDGFGFGVNVNDFSNSSVCNKEKLSSFVMGQTGGGGGGQTTTFGQERTGTGNETVIFVVYLDTDGSTTGGCPLSHNSSAVGYEFRIKYSSVWNANTSKAEETFNAYKCEGSEWKSADIKLSAWKKLMCSEIGGPMLAASKADLAKFTKLYNATKDMRIYVVSIGSTGNITSPTDTAGPGWTTPGSVDFVINDMFSYGANSAMFEDILKKGFVAGEDCFNSLDDDNDGGTDCSDWDCQFLPVCSGSGVNAASYSDTTAPQVNGVKVEEYPDAALVIYDTNKPTNGTLEFYGTDPRCTNRTDAINDIGILRNSTMRQYKLWHEAQIYNDSGAADSTSLNYPLTNATTYYYKLKACDRAGKCAISRCSNFTTPATQAKCSYCSFVTRIKAMSNWDVYYDLNQDGNYEHKQGGVCGPNAGMKTNYTDGRKANIKLMKGDNSTYFEFINATLTKTGLNDKVRTISSSGSIIHDTTKGIIGMPSETRDKIINNLHPEVCKVKIPSSGACDKLYQCDDNGNSCTDRTSEAGGAPVDATNCVWRVPYCEFSTYKTSSPSGSTGGTTTGGSTGGGTTASTFVVGTDQLTSQAGHTGELAAKDRFRFTLGTETHYVTLHSITTTTATINVSSATQQATLGTGETRSFELTNDSYYDISAKLNSINASSSKANFTLKSVHELMPGRSPTPAEDAGTPGITPRDESGSVEPGEGTGGAPAGEPGSIGQPSGADWLIPAAAIAAVIIIIAVIAFARRRKT